MILELLTDVDKKALALPHFPTRLQAVIWRNWGMVPVDRLAEVLGATGAQIVETATELGLDEPTSKIEAKWLERGYITIIRANWHLLPYEQLLQLLGWTEERLAFTLKEDDFLWIKLGSIKPWTEPVRYRPLNAEELAKTLQIRETIAAHFGELRARVSAQDERFEQPFDFLEQYREPTERDRAPARKPDPGELRLDIPWTIEAPQGKPNLESALERFVSKHELNWGTKWAIQYGHALSPTGTEEHRPVMRFEIVPDSSQPAESHTISVGKDAIMIRAATEAGIMQGLQWLAGQMRKRRVPYVIAGEYRRTSKIDVRIIYSYSAVYGDPLLTPELDPYPDELLERLSDAGVNGIWLQSVLYNLVPLHSLEHLSVDWEKRIVGLRRLVERSAKYGIGVYLYCNEPRTMPVSFFADKPDWQGHTEDGQATLCTSQPGVQKLLREGIARLFREVPDLAGLFTITMSENWTNCYSRAVGGRTNCPRCSQRKPSEVVAEVVGLIAEGAFSVKPDARILSWTWGWVQELGWTENERLSAIERLPDNVIVMSTSEEAIPTNIAGVQGQVIDYSISVVGPGEKSLQNWRAANARGLKTAAKVQFNNTWECSAVPFLPVFQLIEEHLARLNESGVSGLLLSWTLGGYPSLNLELAAEYYWDTDTGTKSGIRELLSDKFGSAAGKSIADASAALSQAFQQFPFDLNVVYFAPQNFGPANLLHMQPTGYAATMIGFPYDDLGAWRGIYPEAAFAKQFKKLATGWKKGLRLLEKARKKLLPGAEREFNDLMTAASAAYLHFYSTYLQIDFVMTRNRYLSARSLPARLKACRKLIVIVNEEADNARRLYELVVRDSRIGFEASNHYYYTVQDLQEKALNCHSILEELQQAEGQMAAEGHT
ncbi:hypothetical protein [Cohnella silvisoli]|uniref:Beta-hexosaminidase bacterial type N-terminal domain-containing protein n=1 Tax=Cohnella silvisoli TaxID=2873699 RepID=A0ABV1KRM6_9BACL|nr:hypothetical protein [Cohnella silvisoli]MCD9022455.1 hypothetical protein [Cohnella silvisoli]